MQSKVLYILIAFALTIAAVTAFLDDGYDGDEDAFMTFQDMVEKRARSGKNKHKPKWGTCKDNRECLCLFSRGREIYRQCGNGGANIGI